MLWGHVSRPLSLALAAYRDKDMILKLRIECVRGHFLNEPCIRLIEIDENMDLLDLHEAIQDAVNFGRDHPFEFYLANSSSPWAQKHRLTENEDWRYIDGVPGSGHRNVLIL